MLERHTIRGGTSALPSQHNTSDTHACIAQTAGAVLLLLQLPLPGRHDSRRTRVSALRTC